MMIIELKEEWETKYSEFILAYDKISIYHSLKYRDLLKNCLNSNPHYFLAINSEKKITGVLPSFIKESQFGRIINSLPFFGSHGGAVSENSDTAYLLIDNYMMFAVESQCLSLTINLNLYEKWTEKYLEVIKPSSIINKIGQVKNLPEKTDDVDCTIMAGLHQKTRNIIRRSMTHNIQVSIRNTSAGFAALEKHHVDNMRSKNVLSKPSVFFEYINNHWVPNHDYNLYVAEYKGEIISALLLLYHNKTVEYYCPATKVEYRTMNPLSLLIYHAMIDSVKNGYKFWNWGGASQSQKSVYDFKKKWNTIDVPYFTMNKILNSKICELEAQKATEFFQYFFVYPY